MNAIVQFQLCTLTDQELVQKVDELTDQMYQTGKMHSRNIPARPNDDYDLLVGELCSRFLKIIVPSSSDPSATIPSEVDLPPVEEVMMKVLSYTVKPGYPKAVPMRLLNEEWAQRIHSQSLNRLNERGGLSPSEIVANIVKADPTRISEERAVNYLKRLLS